MRFTTPNDATARVTVTRDGRSVWAGLVGLALTAFTGVLASCIGEQGVAPSTRAPDVTLGSIEASPLNAIMAVGQTLQIEVAGRTLSGSSITSFDSVKYMTQSRTDSIRVAISPTGMVTARAETGNNPVFINVFAFKGALVRADQVVLQITPTAIAGLALSLEPQPGDSLKLAQGASTTLVPLLWNAAGDTISSATFRLTYHDADVGKLGCYLPSFSDFGPFSSAQLSLPTCGRSVGFNQVYAVVNSGTAWAIADAMVYGTHLRDSVQYTLTNPYTGQLAVVPRNLAMVGANALFGTIAIAPGGTLTIANYFDASLGTSIDFVFDDPSALTATDPPATDGGSTGNVIGLAGGYSSARRFLTPGRYHYTITLHGSVPPLTGQTASGDVLVQ